MTKDIDNVNHPKHYNNSNAKCECGRRIECIDVTRHMNFNIGNAMKYLWRYQDKNGLEDLKKARWYLDDVIKQLDGYPMNKECEHDWLRKEYCERKDCIIRHISKCNKCGEIKDLEEKCEHEFSPDYLDYEILKVRKCTKCGAIE